MFITEYKEVQMKATHPDQARCGGVFEKADVATDSPVDTRVNPWSKQADSPTQLHVDWVKGHYTDAGLKSCSLSD